MGALQAQIQNLVQPVQPLAEVQRIQTPKQVQTINITQVKPKGVGAVPPKYTPTSTVVSREEVLDARERALAERERQLEQEALDNRVRVLQARERELEALEALRRNGS